MRILAFELKKLTCRKQFWRLSAFLLLADIALFFLSERWTDRYFYYHENRTAYQAFLSGEDLADFDKEKAVYKSEAQSQENYLSEYHEFINGMEKRAEKEAGILKNDAFALRNIEKTLAAYKKYGTGIQPEKGNNVGIGTFAAYDKGSYFLLLFLLVCVYLLILQERNKGLFFLTKSSLNGRINAAFCKFTAIFIVSVIFTLLMTEAELLMTVWLYGAGDLTRPVQSVPMLRNCIFRMNLKGGLLFLLLSRIFSALVLSSLSFVCFMMSSKVLAAAFLFAAAAVTEMLFLYLIPSNSVLNGFKFVNLFFGWSMEECVGTYVNLNFFGFPVCWNTAAFIAGILFSTASLAAGVINFSRRSKVNRDGFPEIIFRKAMNRIHRLIRPVSLFGFELYKTLIQQKKLLIVMGLVLMSAFLTRDALRPVWFSSAEEAAYNYYMESICGKASTDTEKFINAERERLEKIREELDKIEAAEDSQENEIERIKLDSEIRVYADGFSKIELQYILLKEKRGEEDLWMINEPCYLNYLKSSRKRVLTSIAALLAGVLLTMSLYSYDEKKHLTKILYPTEQGKEGLRKVRIRIAALLFFVSFLTAEVPDLTGFLSVDGGRCINAPLCDITKLATGRTMTLFTLQVLSVLFRLICFLLILNLSLYIERRTENEMTVLILSGGIVLLIGVLLLILKTDITGVILRIMGIRVQGEIWN